MGDRKNEGRGSRPGRGIESPEGLRQREEAGWQREVDALGTDEQGDVLEEGYNPEALAPAEDGSRHIPSSAGVAIEGKGEAILPFSIIKNRRPGSPVVPLPRLEGAADEAKAIAACIEGLRQENKDNRKKIIQASYSQRQLQTIQGILLSDGYKEAPYTLDISEHTKPSASFLAMVLPVIQGNPCIVVELPKVGLSTLAKGEGDIFRDIRFITSIRKRHAIAMEAFCEMLGFSIPGSITEDNQGKSELPVHNVLLKVPVQKVSLWVLLPPEGSSERGIYDLISQCLKELTPEEIDLLSNQENNKAFKKTVEKLIGKKCNYEKREGGYCLVLAGNREALQTELQAGLRQIMDRAICEFFSPVPPVLLYQQDVLGKSEEKKDKEASSPASVPPLPRPAIEGQGEEGKEGERDYGNKWIHFSTSEEVLDRGRSKPGSPSVPLSPKAEVPLSPKGNVQGDGRQASQSVSGSADMQIEGGRQRGRSLLERLTGSGRNRSATSPVAGKSPLSPPSSPEVASSPSRRKSFWNRPKQDATPQR